LTDTYSPVAMDRLPASNPENPAMTTPWGSAPAAATPTIKLALDTNPSLAPNTAARNEPPPCWARCHFSAAGAVAAAGAVSRPS